MFYLEIFIPPSGQSAFTGKITFVFLFADENKERQKEMWQQEFTKILGQLFLIGHNCIQVNQIAIILKVLKLWTWTVGLSMIWYQATKYVWFGKALHVITYLKQKQNFRIVSKVELTIHCNLHVVVPMFWPIYQIALSAVYWSLHWTVIIFSESTFLLNSASYRIKWLLLFFIWSILDQNQ